MVDKPSRKDPVQGTEKLPRAAHKESGFRVKIPEINMEPRTSISDIKEICDDTASVVREASADALYDDLEDTRPGVPRSIERARKRKQLMISEQDREIWDEILHGDASRVGELRHLNPHVAERLIHQWKSPVLALKSLIILTTETARVLARWDGRALYLPDISYVEQPSLDILARAAAGKVFLGSRVIKTPRKD